MKQTIIFSRFKFASLFFAFVVLFAACDSDDNESLSDINRVSMKTLPQVNYIIGSTLNLTDMIITLDKGGNIIDVPFSSFVKEGISTEPANGKVLDASDKSIIIEIGTTGKGLIQAISVTNDVIALEIKQEPKKKYVISQELDLTDMVVTLTYQNGDRKDFTYAEIEKEIESLPANGDKLSKDNKEVVITYITTGVSASVALDVFTFIPLSGVLVTAPLKREYIVGEQLDLSGTVIRYTLFDGSKVDVTFEDFVPYKLTANPTDGTELSANLTEVTIKHVFGPAVVKIPIVVKP